MICDRKGKPVYAKGTLYLKPIPTVINELETSFPCW